MIVILTDSSTDIGIGLPKDLSQYVAEDNVAFMNELEQWYQFQSQRPNTSSGKVTERQLSGGKTSVKSTKGSATPGKSTSSQTPMRPPDYMAPSPPSIESNKLDQEMEKEQFLQPSSAGRIKKSPKECKYYYSTLCNL